MNIPELINKLRGQGISLWVQDDNLCYIAPKGALSPELRLELSAQKTTIIEFLRSLDNSVDTPTAQSFSNGEKSFSASRTLLEAKLVEIWSQVLGIKQVGIHDNFFELGGDSLLALRVINRAEQAGMTITPIKLFKHQTIANLIKNIDLAQTNQSEALSLLHPIKLANRQGNIPLSFAQQRLWILDQLEPEGATAYTLPMTSRLKGWLNVDALKQALAEIMERHEVLRTTFMLLADQPVQIVSAFQSVPLFIHDLRHLIGAEQETQLLRLVSEETCQPFDLAKGPLFRAILFKIAEDDQVLLITLHHIISDGWSLNILRRELITLYNTFVRQEPLPWTKLPIQYGDYATWQREWLQGEVLEEQLTYWKQRLAGVSPLLEFPTNRPRPAVQSFRGARQEFQFSLSLSEELKALSQQAEATMFMLLLAALQTLLYRYTQQDDFCIGMPTAGRPNAQVEALIGFFVNTLVFRAEMAGDPTFLELLMRVRQQALETYSHQDLPFEQLIDALQVQRDLSHSPLFQVMLSFQNLPREERDDLQWAGLTRHSFFVADSRATMFDLTIYIWNSPQGLGGIAEYNADLFDATTITHLLEHFQILLEGIAVNPNQRLSALPLLTEAEQNKMLVEWNKTQREFPRDKCIHELFEEQVKRTPDAVAVLFKERQLTYRELNEQANQLAHYLQKLGVGSDVFVGLCLERSLEMVVGVLGILKAGGAYVPLDPGYPSERLGFIFEDAAMPILLTHRHLEKTLPLEGQQVMFLDDLKIISSEKVSHLSSQRNVLDLAYVIYTSGSTGLPKGVQIQHRSVVNFLVSMQDAFQLTQDDTLLSVTTLSFDIAGLELFLPLSVGAKVVIASRDMVQDPSELSDALVRHKVTFMQATPITWQMLVISGWEGMPGLKVLCGGDVLSRDLAQNLLKRCERLWNLYGPTETTIWSTLHAVTSGDGPISIGRPIANTQIYLLDAHLQPVPIGVPGELYIGGEGLARGYLHRPELTQERFIPNPFSSTVGERLYKTGDLACYRSNGDIAYLRRIDHQVKIRGFRIELGEIEAVLKRYLGLQQAAVIVREDTPGDKRLVAYGIVNEQRVPSTTELRSFLAEKLPEYMIPSAFVFLDAFPLTPNGKLDRKALPAPNGERVAAEHAYVAPRTPSEEKLAQIWSRVLGVNEVGVYDNFFELGGDSLLALHVLNSIGQMGLSTITPRQLFEHKTIAELAVIIDSEESAVGMTPLTPNQVELLDGNLLNYHALADIFEVNWMEPIWVEAVVRYLNAYYDELRTRFVKNGSAWQKIIPVPDDTSPFVYIDLSTLPDDEQKPTIENITLGLQSDFDLVQGKLWRAVFFDLGKDRPCRLFIAAHPIVSDHPSLLIIFENFQTAYRQLSANQNIQLPSR